jgi:hypothetical protein
VPPGHKMLTYFFSCSGGPDADSRKKCNGTLYAQLEFLHPTRSMAHVVSSGASGKRKASMNYFSCSGGSDAHPEIMFYIQIDLWIMYSVRVHPGHETLMHYFSCSSGRGAVPIKGTT